MGEVRKIRFVGGWRIISMGIWEADYFDMDVPAYIQVGKNWLGRFQFGLVTGDIDGRIVKHPGGNRFEFTWEGTDESEPCSGSGWMSIHKKEVDNWKKSIEP